MTYSEWLKERQDEVNKLPIFYAFSDKQFERELSKRGLTVYDTDKLYRLGNSGGFYLKTDAPIINAFLEKEDELPKLMENLEFAEQAFYYEMGNHEYHINWQADWEIIDRDANGQRCYQCPECGVAEWRYDAADFCPHCGADMRRSDVQ